MLRTVIRGKHAAWSAGKGNRNVEVKEATSCMKSGRLVFVSHVKPKLTLWMFTVVIVTSRVVNQYSAGILRLFSNIGPSFIYCIPR